MLLVSRNVYPQQISNAIFSKLKGFTNSLSTKESAIAKAAVRKAEVGKEMIVCRSCFETLLLIICRFPL